MLRRWLIRLCFILPIVLCVLAWAWSTSHSAHVSYTHLASHTAISCGVNWGEIFVTRVDGTWEGRDRWSVYADSGSFHMMDPCFVGPSGTSFLGFGYERTRSKTLPSSSRTLPSSFRVFLPLWFPTLIFSALLIPVWRKTRPARTERSFPVEPSEPAQSPGDPAA